MDWEYADYILLTGKERTKRLKQHVLEVSQAIKTGYLSRSGGDGWAISRHNLDNYLRSLKEELSEMTPTVRPKAAFYGLK